MRKSQIIPQQTNGGRRAASMFGGRSVTPPNYMWQRVAIWLTLILLAAFWVGAIYFIFSQPMSLDHPMPHGR